GAARQSITVAITVQSVPIGHVEQFKRHRPIKGGKFNEAHLATWHQFELAEIAQNTGFLAAYALQNALLPRLQRSHRLQFFFGHGPIFAWDQIAVWAASGVVGETIHAIFKSGAHRML